MTNETFQPNDNCLIFPVTAQGQGKGAYTMESMVNQANDAPSDRSNPDSDRGTLAIPTPEGYTDDEWAGMLEASKALDFDYPPSPWKDPFAHIPPSHHIYFVGGDSGPVKIGFTQQPLLERLKCIQTGSPIKLAVLAVQHAPKQRERVYHKQFAAARLHGEWFARTPEVQAEIDRLNGITQALLVSRKGVAA